MSHHRIEIPVGGRPLIIETGQIARQADGAALVRQGDTVVLVTACAAREPRDAGFLPLTVDYREGMYAAGKVPGGFFKREGRPNEKETLSSRLIDRPIRPLFPKGWNHETQIIAFVLSADRENNPDVLALTGASFALALSSIPFANLIGAVRVGLVDDRYVINPTHAEVLLSKLDIVVAATEEAIVMVEAGAKEATEAELVGALFAGQEAIRPIVAAQKELAARAGNPKREFVPLAMPDELRSQVHGKARAALHEAMQIRGKLKSYAKVDELLDQLVEELGGDDAQRAGWVREAFDELQDEILHEHTLSTGRRLDGRAPDEIRPVTIELGLLPRTHGSALFTRGETQALVTTTLGTSADTQRIDWMEIEGEKRFMLHYNFPPFSVGEVRFLRGPGRREIGHGALAERALRPLIPDETKFPYTIRLVSDILESNGSSSMASVCGGSLALMDAGVPTAKPVAGIAMGLVMRAERCAVLTDIAGAEDHHGDMDFKVAGTREGVTALQMDIKIGGVNREILTNALEQARRARMQLLDIMEQAISTPRAEVSPYAPRILTLYIPKDKIRDVIGPGGKIIRSIQEKTGCEISIEDDGRVDIASVDLDGARRAADMIKELTAEAELGKTYIGRVVRTTNFGAFVEILPGVEGLLHISEIAEHRIKQTTDEIEEGDEVLVKVIDIDAQGRIRLSRKAAMKEQQA
ncbi:MAG: polyribonucleotide nucleotidyltransferase [Acidobacteria bacterium]|nr:polyribonucleotide nucleotidyltransferase [Acidobacteriota bacterium]